MLAGWSLILYLFIDLGLKMVKQATQKSGIAGDGKKVRAGGIRELVKHRLQGKKATSTSKGGKAEKASQPATEIGEPELEQLPKDEKGEQIPNPYLLEVIDLMKTIPEWDEFFSRDDEETVKRGSNWIRLEVLGQPLIDKYSWAIPNQRAINIIKHFSPVIEIGSGKGYWASLLRNQGVEVEAFDRHVYNVPATITKKNKNKTPKLWTIVKKGDARMLMKKCYQKHTLMLCYPDEDSEMSMDCLERYDGEYLLHIGELVTTGTYSGGTQAPFGRTTCSQFQVSLLEYFHCILVAELPCFPFSKDCITVWKRTVFVPGRSAYGPKHKNRERSEDLEVADGGDGEDHESDGEEEEIVESADGDEEEECDADENEDCWADLPRIERLPIDRAATELAFLLEEEDSNNKGSAAACANTSVLFK